MKKTIIAFLVIILIVGAGAFFAGVKYGQSKSFGGRNFGNLSAEQREALMQRANVGGAGFRGGAERGGGFTVGEIISKDEQNLTVKLPDGSSKIVFFSSSTEISKFTEGNSDDLKTGETIMVSGTTNSDGSITASNIQIRPEAQRFQNLNR